MDGFLDRYSGYTMLSPCLSRCHMLPTSGPLGSFTNVGASLRHSTSTNLHPRSTNLNRAGGEAMSNAGVQPVSPAGTGSKRHQIKRSITDVTSSGKNHRGQRDAERHHEHRQHRHRKDHHRDGSAVQMANPALSLRRSLDVPRGEATPAAGLDQSRRASTLPKELDGALENREERLQQEREEALFRAE